MQSPMIKRATGAKRKAGPAQNTIRVFVVSVSHETRRSLRRSENRNRKSENHVPLLMTALNAISPCDAMP